MAVSRTGSGPFYELEDYTGLIGDLVTVKTGSDYRQEVISTIRRNFADWMKHHRFEDIRESKLDIAIIVSVTPHRMKCQDVDNIAKAVLDALKKSGEDNRFLFHDDRQIIRMLVWKIEQKTLQDYNTDTLTISFRKHNPEKQMILIETRNI